MTRDTPVHDDPRHDNALDVAGATKLEEVGCQALSWARRVSTESAGVWQA